METKTYKRYKDSISIEDLDEYGKTQDYMTRPTEVFSYLGTNLRDELVNDGVIKSVHDKIQLKRSGKSIRNSNMGKI